MPGGTITSGKVFYKAAEADFATQRDVNRRKRDIKTIVLKIRLDNPKGAYVPGMTAEVLVSPDQIAGLRPNQDVVRGEAALSGTPTATAGPVFRAPTAKVRTSRAERDRRSRAHRQEVRRLHGRR